MTPRQADHDSHSVGIGGFLAIVAGAVVAWAAFWYFVVNSSLAGWPERGLFGDMFGALNALFSGLAFAGVIYTILLQRTELELQRNEMSLARVEANRQAKSAEDSARLAALSELIAHYARRLSAAQAEADKVLAGPIPPPLQVQIRELQKEYAAAVSELETIYKSLFHAPDPARRLETAKQ
jgi:hypothetical protein